MTMIRARKRFSQNFLQDQQIIQQIIRAVDPTARAHIVEIGPGRGALTASLLTTAKAFTAIEIDRDLIQLLQETYPELQENLIDADVLKVDFNTLKPTPLTVIGNLPYNISTPILFHLLKFKQAIEHMFFMLQKEVVLRMAANPGSKDYGRLSVMTQYFCKVEPLFSVPPHAFIPQPQVDSMVVHLKPYVVSPYGPLDDLKRFEQIVQHAFGQRRKTLRNALKPLGMDLPEHIASKRAEVLSVADFVALSQTA